MLMTLGDFHLNRPSYGLEARIVENIVKKQRGDPSGKGITLIFSSAHHKWWGDFFQ